MDVETLIDVEWGWRGGFVRVVVDVGLHEVAFYRVAC